VQGNFRVVVRTEELSAFERNGAVAERGSFGAAGDDADVERHSGQGPVISGQLVLVRTRAFSDSE
jgi:hypothetical protein